MTVMSTGLFKGYSACGKQGAGQKGSRCVSAPKRWLNCGLAWHDLPLGQDNSLVQCTSALVALHVGIHMWDKSHAETW